VKRRLCGVRAVQEALAADARVLALVLTTDDSAHSPHARLLDVARGAGIAVEPRTAAALDAIAGGVRHQGIIAISALDYPYVDLENALAAARAPMLLVALDEVTDVQNMGAIVRSSVALGADAVLTLRDRAAPVNAAVVRASAGASEHARIVRVTNLSRTLVDLDERGVTSIGLDAAGDRTLGELDLAQPIVLVTGSEGRGLRRLVRERCTVLARIPMAGPLGSLNASVATAIALYEVQRQRAATQKRSTDV
jgi:23S rRNA (guanosine2251-2'-O)-methyltransferase